VPNFEQKRKPDVVTESTPCRDLIAHETTGAWSKMAPFRILSMDIECQGRKGCFPEPEKDKVIQIATTVQHVGEKEPFLRHVLTLSSCSAIPAAQVESFDREEDLLCRFALFRELNMHCKQHAAHTCCKGASEGSTTHYAQQGWPKSNACAACAGGRSSSAPSTRTS
jgi:DNA polymerase family B, exonuclease domain